MASAFAFQSMITSACAGVAINVAAHTGASIAATRILDLSCMGLLQYVSAPAGRDGGRSKKSACRWHQPWRGTSFGLRDARLMHHAFTGDSRIVLPESGK